MDLLARGAFTNMQQDQEDDTDGEDSVRLVDKVPGKLDAPSILNDNLNKLLQNQ